MSLSFHLFQIQKIDSQIDKLNLRKLEIEKLISENSYLNSLQIELSQAESEWSKVNSDLLQLAEEANKKKIKIQQSEASLYSGSISNPKELQSIQDEISSLKKRIQELEDDQLTMMMDLEEREKKVGVIKSQISKETEKKKENESALNIERQQNDRLLEKLVSERGLITSQLSSEHMKMYEDLRKRKRNLAITLITEETCSGCGTQLTPAEIQSAKSPDQLIFCPACGRILYAG